MVLIMDRPGLRLLTYGLYVASVGGGEIVAAVINWVSQTSFNPPLVVIALKKDSSINRMFRIKRYMTLNVVPKGDIEMVKAFFGKLNFNDDSVNGYRYKVSGKSGGIILLDSVGYIDVELVDVVEMGDHDIFICKYVDGEVFSEDKKPLVIWDTPWYYGG